MLSSVRAYFHALLQSPHVSTVVTAALASVALSGAGVLTAGVVGLSGGDASAGAAADPVGTPLGPAPAAVSSGPEPAPTERTPTGLAGSSSAAVPTAEVSVPAAGALPDYSFYPPAPIGAGPTVDAPRVAPAQKVPTKAEKPKRKAQEPPVSEPIPVGPVSGQSVVFAQANIPNRSGANGVRAGLNQVLGARPDFVALNEMSKFSTDQIEGYAPGYRAYRAPLGTGADRNQALGTAVLWRSAGWRLADGGRVQIVNDDRTTFRGRSVRWDRFATWVTLESTTSAAVVSIISTHHMTNPGKYGPDKPVRQRQYGTGMDRLVTLIRTLSDRGEVLLAGDMNTHASQRESWTAVSKMSAAGFSWMNHSVDFVFFRPSAVLTDSCTLSHPSSVSDHAFPVAQLLLGQGAKRARPLPC